MSEEPLPEVRWTWVEKRPGLKSPLGTLSWNPMGIWEKAMENRIFFGVFFFPDLFPTEKSGDNTVPFCRAVWPWWRFSCTTPTAGIFRIALDHISFSQLET